MSMVTLLRKCSQSSTHKRQYLSSHNLLDIMRSVYFSFCLILLVFLQGLGPSAFAKTHQDEYNRAINRYVAFTNECLHLLYEFRGGLESLNQTIVIAYEDNQTVDLRYSFEEFYRDKRLYTFLQGSCERTSPAIDQGLDLEILYQRTKNNQVLPEQTRLALNKFRDQLWYLVLESLEKNHSLSVAAQTHQGGDYSELFDLLESIERAYEDIDQEVTKLRSYLEEITPPVPVALQPFTSLTTTGEALLHAIRVQDPAAIAASRLALGQSIDAARRAKMQYINQLTELGVWFENDDEQAYDHAIEYGELLLKRSTPAALASHVRNTWTRHTPSYFHYNIRLLDIYNHHKYGLTSYYKSLIQHANRVFVHPLDVAPWFKAIRPELPEPELANAPAQPTPTSARIPDPSESLSLATAPTNNLIFLIDVSASMNSTDKLPVFKENLEFLVSLFRPEDKIAIVTFSEQTSLVLESTTGNHGTEIKSAIRSIRTGGETRVKKGFKEAYRIAEEQYIFNGTNRVILITDGIFDTDRAVESTISRGAGKGVQLSVMLLGRREATPVKAKLSQLAELGEGRYSHLRSDNAKEVLVHEAKGE